MIYKSSSISFSSVIIAFFILVGSGYTVWMVSKDTQEVSEGNSTPNKSQVRDVSVSGNQETIIPVAHPSEDLDVNRKLGEGVIATLRAEGQVLVVIGLRPPRAPLTDLPALKQEIAGLQASVLSELSPSEFRLVQKYEAVPSLSGWVLNEDSLTILAANPHVVRIDLDVGGSGGGSRH